VKDLSQFRVLPTEPRIPWTAYTGAAGMPGQTAFVGWKEYSAAKKVREGCDLKCHVLLTSLFRVMSSSFREVQARSARES
jgi:hypothetical protein